MSGTRANGAAGTTGNTLKKSIGKIIININSEILELIEEKKKVKNDVPLSKKGVDRENAVRKKKEALEDALKGLEERPEFVTQEKMEKFVDMIKENIATAAKALTDSGEENDALHSEAVSAQKTATATVETIVQNEKTAEEEMRTLANNLVQSAVLSDDVEGVTIYDEDEDQLNRELSVIGKYQSDRVGNMIKGIKEKMDFHRANLLSKWDAQKDIILDYQALKEIRSEMEATHKQLRFMVSEWDRRKLSDRISDHLMDCIDKKHEEYMEDYRRMDEEKRTEAAVQRKRHLELDEYKREKRRNIPSWPPSLPYSKFRPELKSWDKEHHLSTGSVKFGLLAEMLKSQGHITMYEQIQVRLGNNRTDDDIITQVVTLLDQINEETIFNKLNNAWEGVINLKRTKDQSLNDFISKFETIQYSLNLSDDSFKEQVPVVGGKDKVYYEEREQIALRRVEMNDKLKAVQLIKALGVDGAFKRDIIAKIDFNQEPSKVYEQTKTAIRDIVGDDKHLDEVDNQNVDNVNIVKPWQGGDRSRSWERRGRERFPRSRSRDSRAGKFGDGNRSFSRDKFGDGNRSFSRERGFDRSRERSDSRGRRGRSGVSFRERSRRDVTPGPGMSKIVELNEAYHSIYLNDDFFKHKSRHHGQFMIVDCGCPRSLMGSKEYNKMKDKYSTEKIDAKDQKFRFGPS